MAIDIKGIERRTAQSWFDDGIWEMGFGVIGLLLAFYFFGQSAAPAGSAARWILDIGLLPLFLLAGWIMKTLVAVLKRRLTLRRTGYVAFRKTGSRKRSLAAAIVGALVGLATPFAYQYLKSHRPAGMDMLPILMAFGFVLMLVLLALRTGAIRLVFDAAAVAAAGMAVSLARWNESASIAGVFGALAAALFISGGVTLGIYLRRNPGPTADSE
jgi:hypothetical protein